MINVRYHTDDSVGLGPHWYSIGYPGGVVQGRRVK